MKNNSNQIDEIYDTEQNTVINDESNSCQEVNNSQNAIPKRIRDADPFDLCKEPQYDIPF